jgi:hypothetical protein
MLAELGRSYIELPDGGSVDRRDDVVSEGH